MGYHKRDIIALERKVKEAFAKDKSAPEMYTTIKELAAAILVVKRMAFNSNEVDEISHMLATDFYLKINHEGLVVEKWTKYIRLRLYNARSEYLNETRGVEFEVSDVIEAEQFRDQLFGSANRFRTEQAAMELDSVVQSMSTLALEILDSYVHYKPGTTEYEFIKISVMFTIEDKLKYNRGRVVLVKLGDEYRPYVRFLVSLIYKRLGVNLRKLLGDDLHRSSELSELIGASWNIDNSD